MKREDAEFLAHLLYKEVITEAGHAHPNTYEEMLAIFLEAGADVVHCPDLPARVPGVCIGGTVYINASETVTEHQRIRLLAHEFAHFKRRSRTFWPRHIRFFRIVGGRVQRDDEEQIARAFMRLF